MKYKASAYFQKNIFWFSVGLLLPALFAFQKLQERRVFAVMLDKQKVFYVGVENPITIALRGVDDQDLKVTGIGLYIEDKTNGHYIVSAKKSGEGSIVVSVGGFSEKFDFLIKKIPDPTPVLGNKVNGIYEPNRLLGIGAVLKNFDYEGICEITKYNVTYFGKGKDPVTKSNIGARFNAEIIEMVKKGVPGDSYYFDDIKVICSGDEGERELGSLIFKVK
jgi:GldM C-terminal domain